MNPPPVLDPAAIFRRLARGPNDCRRCGLPTDADQLDGTVLGRSCPHFGHAWTYPAPIDLPDQDQLAESPPPIRPGIPPHP